MKKILLLSFLFVTAFYFADAQLSGSKWKGMLKVPDPMQTVLEFKNDTLVNVINVSEDNIVETMSYVVKDSVISLRKISGSSPCDENTIGRYKITWKDDKFTIALIEDGCDIRGNAFTSEPWEKIK